MSFRLYFINKVISRSLLRVYSEYYPVMYLSLRVLLSRFQCNEWQPTNCYTGNNPDNYRSIVESTEQAQGARSWGLIKGFKTVSAASVVHGVCLSHRNQAKRSKSFFGNFT